MLLRFRLSGRTDGDCTTGRRRTWPANVMFLGGGMVLGGGVDISGPGDAVLLLGINVALVGFGGLLFSRR